MEHNNRLNPFGSKISVQSRKSQLSASRSLGRPSWQIREPSLGNKASLIYAMSIQSERRSDIFEKLLQSDQKKNRTSNILFGASLQSDSDYKGYDSLGRKSDLQGGQNDYQIQIQHQCKCFDNCYEQNCPCFLAKNQFCVKGLCCKRCIQLKNVLLRSKVQQNQVASNRGHHSNQMQQQNRSSIVQQYHLPDPNNPIHTQQTLTCNCKNTQCLKSYCKCFQNGGFCNEKCGCQSCKNKQHSEQRTKALMLLKQRNNNGQVVFCTCKKTKCNKKYCSCYAAGILCGKQCSCEGCTNCDHSNDMMDVEVYEGEEEEDLVGKEMPQRMSFQPFRFQ